MWLSAAEHIPARWDLRLIGWELRTAQTRPDLPRILDGRLGCTPSDWRALADTHLLIAVGVDCAETRAAMLSRGFADALPALIGLGELALRLSRIRQTAGVLPRQRLVGPLVLDLFHRDAMAGGRWLALHPREFALLWRLAESAGERVGRAELLHSVWRLREIPETNSLEVHVSRLRGKLALAGVSGLVETDPAGGYRLSPAADGEERWTGAAPLRQARAG